MTRNLSTMQKLVASAAVLATAGALTAGAFAAWQSTGSQHQDIGAARITSTMTATGGGDWVDTDVANVLPGYTLTRYATLTNTGSVPQTFTLTVDGTNTEDGLTATSAGMQVQIKACTVPWVLDACTGTEVPAATTPQELAYIGDGTTSDTFVLAKDAVTYLQVFFGFPSGASQSAFQDHLDKFMVDEVGVPTADAIQQTIAN